ncbi:PREDICTED: protein NLP7-like isoform X2 [Tarenaya hassleriana]|uniref:protein NLP7-like isoform X2 n=1 Tax=Tarenaya hassleriana TaxID=28532 RepID=UPI00053C0850|nr:PREDICTED: protein NLP7-like isoform X2 [Tarenaya hassleriana]
MCEPDEDSTRNGAIPPLPRPRELLMDLDDLDLDGSWPLDQIPHLFSSNQFISPFVVSSSSEQPFSPLWAFSDGGGTAAVPTAGDDEKLSPNSGAASSKVENTAERDRNVQFPSPLTGLAPPENTDNYCVIKERMTQALRYFKESTEQQILAQVWAPVRKNGRELLTTLGQPFVLNPNGNGLNQYRMISLTYMFSVDSESDIELGLPGRVYRQKLPEWTPNVQYYSSREFSRLDHALHYNVRGTLALPVFNPSGQSCIGVVELIMTSEKIHYAPEVDRVCKALEAVNLKSSEILDHQTTQICNEGRQNALAEILEILTVVCETYKLPLAQTWVPCQHRSVLANGGGLKKSCTSFDGSCMGQVCMSTTDMAAYVVDAHVWGFRDACLEHHLQKGQGVAGRAFLNRSSCFCRDVTKFCKIQYPLVHYALMFKLTSCYAICLQSSHTGDDDYILEFFLPPAITDKSEQDSLLGSLLATMKQHFQSLRVASGISFGEEANEVSVEFIEALPDKKLNSRIESIHVPSSGFESNVGEMLLDPQPVVPSSEPVKETSNVADDNGVVKEMKKPERKRGKTEKTISLDVLQQYFTGSLKDAAKSLGVCPTTMKRICRQHGISRWPSRKIKKVNRSITKLKRVIESVQGTDGALDLTSMAVGSIPWTNGQATAQPLNSPSGYKEPEPPKNNDSTHNGSNGHSPHEPHGSPPSNGCKPSRTRDDSVGTPTSHGSCEGSYRDEMKALNPEPIFMADVSAASFSMPNRILGSIEPFRGMPIEESGSSKDLRNLCHSVAADEKFPESNWLNNGNNIYVRPEEEAMEITRVASGSETRSVTIKASYKEDIIRFRISSSSGLMELKEEIAKRLKLDAGTFDIKYLDDDSEWVLIACDVDLQECLDISGFSGSSLVRLLVQDVMANPGSSCESTGEL